MVKLLAIVMLLTGCAGVHKQASKPSPAIEFHVPPECVDDINCFQDATCSKKKAMLTFHCYKVVETHAPGTSVRNK